MAFEISGYNALRETAALIDLTGRGHIRVTGADRARLLHAMTTNHVQELTPGRSVYAFFLTAQGRILADVNILCDHDALLLDTEPATRARVYEHLDRYIIADDVTLADETEQVAVFGLEGPKAAEVLGAMGVVELPAPLHWRQWRDVKIAGLTACGGAGYRLFVPRAAAAELRQWVLGMGVAMATESEWNVVRVENARPRYGVDITEAQIPHETQMMSALHFNKGCYLGQEIVERVRSRGHVNKKLMQLELAGDVERVEKKLTLDGREVGELTSVVWSPAANRVIALGYVRLEAASGKGALRCGELPVTISGRTPA
jgi:aminomethyltransferase